MTAKAFCHIYAQLDQTRNRLPLELEHMFALGLVCDAAVGFKQAEAHAASLMELVKRGGSAAPTIYPPDLDKSFRDPNWWRYSKEDCLRLLKIAKARYEAIGLGPMESVNTYTPGNNFVEACREIGVKTILGFCAPIVIEDGDWAIAHYGSPLSPYFISGEDFRKPENPASRPDPVAMVSMELRNPAVCLAHWSEGPWCPLNAQAVDRWLEPSSDPLPFMAIAQDWMEQSRLSGRPLMFHINLQYFFAGRCFEHNRRALEWLASMREAGRVENGSIKDWTSRMRAAGGFLRQASYWRGEMMGFHVGHRPGSYPDVIVDESLDGQTVWRAPEAAPLRHYSYKRAWSCHAFKPDGSDPASESYEGVKAETSIVAESGLTRRVHVQVSNPGEGRELKLALWGLFNSYSAPFEFRAPSQWKGLAVPEPSGSGGALLLEGFAPKGSSSFEIEVSGAAKSACVSFRKWGSLLVARTFRFGSRICTFIVSQTPESFSVMLRKAQSAMQGDEPVEVESLMGIDHSSRELGAAGMPLQFEPSRLACFHRVWGLDASQIEISGVEEVELSLRSRTSSFAAKLLPGLEIPAPGYQLFGDIRDKSKWDVQLGRAAGLAERKAINNWMRALHPGCGEFLIEAHPGILLPRGSITKVLGHAFDLVECAGGFSFREQCADYPQGFDWGVSAWVQWRHLNLAIGGLQGRKDARYSLHLHAFDPESRGIFQRVHLYDASKPEKERLEICAVRSWTLPKGLSGRFDESALASFEIPDECKAWPEIGVWISPVEGMRLFDWVREKGAPGLLCHLWLTKS